MFLTFPQTQLQSNVSSLGYPWMNFEHSSSTDATPVNVGLLLLNVIWAFRNFRSTDITPVNVSLLLLNELWAALWMDRGCLVIIQKTKIWQTAFNWPFMGSTHSDRMMDVNPSNWRGQHFGGMGAEKSWKVQLVQACLFKVACPCKHLLVFSAQTPLSNSSVVPHSHCRTPLSSSASLSTKLSMSTVGNAQGHQCLLNVSTFLLKSIH